MAGSKFFARKLMAYGAPGGPLDRQIRRNMVEMVKTIHEDLVRATPFDTGRAAASWNASLNGPNLRIQPKEVLFENADDALASTEINVDDFMMGDEIHISNSVPYIRRLNAGHSMQAPSGFVEKTVQQTAGRRTLTAQVT